MDKNKSRRKLSSQILLIVMILIVAGVVQLPLCLYAMRRYEKLNRQVENNIGEAFFARTDQMLYYISTDLRTRIYENEHFRRAVEGWRDTDPSISAAFERNGAISAVINDFAKMASDYGGSINFILYDPISGQMAEFGGEEVGLRTAVARQLKEDLETGDADSFGRGKWIIYRGEYLCMVAKGTYGYAGSWVRISALTDGISGFSRGTKMDIAFYDRKQQVLYVEQRRENQIRSVSVTAGEQVTEGYRDFAYGDFAARVTVTGQDLTVTLVIQALLAMFFAAYLAVVAGILVYIRRNILRQANYFYDNLLKLSAGMQVNEKNGIVEFAEAGKVMNQLTEEINRLKISAYEEQLARRKVELEYAQLQIRPHFYINCLNVIFSMAQTGKTAEIQNIVIHVSDYLRYTFKRSMKPVALRTELEFIDNYLKILESISASGYQLCQDIESGLGDFPVPPFLIQTFVENSVKYGADASHGLRVEIRAKRILQDGTSYVNITVCDSGEGLKEDMCEALNEGRFMVEDESYQVGFRNAVQRMKMLYGETAQICFGNSGQGGTQVSLYIPYRQEAGAEHDAADKD